MEKWQSIVDQIIEEARERGEFDLAHLKGKRLREDGNEAHARDRALAHKVLANSGYAPPFLMKKREIEERLDKERTRLLRYALRRRRLHAEADTAAEAGLAKALRERAETDWEWATRQFELALPDINRNIELFNLMNEIPNLFKMKVRLEREIERVEQEVAGQGA